MDPRPPLTPALVEILDLSDKHDTIHSKELAEILGKSTKTIDKQWEGIIKHYEAHGRWEARARWRAGEDNRLAGAYPVCKIIAADGRNLRQCRMDFAFRDCEN